MTTLKKYRNNNYIFSIVFPLLPSFMTRLIPGFLKSKFVSGFLSLLQILNKNIHTEWSNSNKTENTDPKLKNVISGCTEPPTEPEHAKLRCSFYSGCSLSCKRGYALPGGVYASYVMCENGKWISQDTGTTEMPKCQREYRNVGLVFSSLDSCSLELRSHYVSEAGFAFCISTERFSNISSSS